MPILLCDIDEVVLQWKPAFDDYLVSLGYDHDRASTANFDELIGNEVWEHLRYFNTHPELFSSLPLYRDAQQILPAFKDRGWEIIGITAAGTHPATIEARARNISSLLPGVFTTIHHVEYHDGKEKWLAHYPRGVWVDDVWHHIEAGMPYHDCFHMPRVWDRDMSHPEVKRVENWWEVWRHIYPTG